MILQVLFKRTFYKVFVSVKLWMKIQMEVYEGYYTYAMLIVGMQYILHTYTLHLCLLFALKTQNFIISKNQKINSTLYKYLLTRLLK